MVPNGDSETSDSDEGVHHEVYGSQFRSSIEVHGIKLINVYDATMAAGGSHWWHYLVSHPDADEDDSGKQLVYVQDQHGLTPRPNIALTVRNDSGTEYLAERPVDEHGELVDYLEDDEHLLYYGGDLYDTESEDEGGSSSDDGSNTGDSSGSDSDDGNDSTIAEQEVTDAETPSPASAADDVND